jgi:hypothetical protein
VRGQAEQRHGGAGQQRGPEHQRAAREPRPHRRHHRPGRDRADAHHGQHQAEGRRPQLQPLAHHQRQQGPDGGGEDEEGAGAQDGRAHGRRGGDEAHPRAHGAEQALARQPAPGGGGPAPGEQRPEQRQEGEGVEREGGGRPGRGQDEAAERRAERAGQVEADAVQRDGADQVLARHQLRRGRRPGGEVHRGAGADGEGQRQQAPGAERVRRGQGGQQHAHGRDPELGRDQREAAVEDVGRGAAGQGEEEDRQHGGRLHQADHQRRGRERGHQPAGAGVLDPHAGVGGEVGDPERPEGRVAEGGEGARRTTCWGTTWCGPCCTDRRAGAMAGGRRCSLRPA